MILLNDSKKKKSSFFQNPWDVMAFHQCVRSVTLIWRTNRTRWRPRWSCWLRERCSSVSASSGFTRGALDTPKDPPSGSAEKPPHTPVLLKEVLHYLDIQRGEVCLVCIYTCMNVLHIRMLVYQYLTNSRIMRQWWVQKSSTTDHLSCQYWKCDCESWKSCSNNQSLFIEQPAVPREWKCIRKKRMQNWG